jgi:hypothetical protein
MALALLYMPVAVISGWLGNVCGDRLPHGGLLAISYILLLIIAVFSILGPLW